MTEKDMQKRRNGRVEPRINTALDGLPGERGDLPDSALGGVPTDPQGDENRDPSRKAPITRPNGAKVMSEEIQESEIPEIGALHEVRATFDDPDAMQEAVARLEMSGFDRADLSLPENMPPSERATPEAGAKAVDTEEDARQTRTLHTGGAAAAVGMAAAGVVIASGGAAAPAVAAAAVGAGAAGGIAYLLSSASNQDEQADRERKAASGLLVLSVRARNAEKRAKAEMILRAAGGTELESR
jgi:hypothetical protein